MNSSIRLTSFCSLFRASFRFLNPLAERFSRQAGVAAQTGDLVAELEQFEMVGLEAPQFVGVGVGTWSGSPLPGRVPPPPGRVDEELLSRGPTVTLALLVARPMRLRSQERAAL